LPPPFTDMQAVFPLLHPDTADATAVAPVIATIGAHGDAPRRAWPIHRPSFAIPAIFSATDRDPLQALVETFSHAEATFDDHRDALIAELRQRFLPTG
jgi:hypothetical protein